MLPAPGFRGSGEGAMDSAGEHGASWSSSTDDTSAQYIAYRTHYFNSSHSDRRSYGFQLRCLSE
ncbi:hypothetical protein [uncultured Rikenella sp.]|uniref:hypothetical protein n=1 Tax=uncultured Rikenella sp. TaxID=368003 RepID=UPI00260E4E36|nr:hypothetical protein [uncultured Rikenella sp.]